MRKENTKSISIIHLKDIDCWRSAKCFFLLLEKWFNVSCTWIPCCLSLMAKCRTKIKWVALRVRLSQPCAQGLWINRGWLEIPTLGRHLSLILKHTSSIFQHFHFLSRAFCLIQPYQNAVYCEPEVNDGIGYVPVPPQVALSHTGRRVHWTDHEWAQRVCNSKLWATCELGLLPQTV